jgi:hypothetical protein
MGSVGEIRAPNSSACRNGIPRPSQPRASHVAAPTMKVDTSVPKMEGEHAVQHDLVEVDPRDHCRSLLAEPCGIGAEQDQHERGDQRHQHDADRRRQLEIAVIEVARDRRECDQEADHGKEAQSVRLQRQLRSTGIPCTHLLLYCCARSACIELLLQVEALVAGLRQATAMVEISLTGLAAFVAHPASH